MTFLVQDCLPSHIANIAGIERLCHRHPWSEQAFLDCINSHYWFKTVVNSTKMGDNPHAKGACPVIAYAIAQRALDEINLLNITVSPKWQGKGHAHQLMQLLIENSQTQGIHSMWLEVRTSNVKAIRFYEKLNFKTISIRKNYYPIDTFHREDARIMRLDLAPLPPPTSSATHAKLRA